MSAAPLVQPLSMDSTSLMGALLLLLPVAASLILFALPRKAKWPAWIGIGAMGASLLLAVFVLLNVGGEPSHWRAAWFYFDGAVPRNVTSGILIDKWTAVLVVVVTLVSFLVHLHSRSYLAQDNRPTLYFAQLSLFTAAMLGLLLADNYLQMFLGWELMGFCSYLLIGFWYEDKEPPRASLKAFLINRIGDVGVLGGLLILWAAYGSFDRVAIETFVTGGGAAAIEPVWIEVAGGCFLVGALAKSAQLPLQVWLPDAMAGPTPVSALIHAATMVAAGIILMGRITPLLAPSVLDGMAWIGGLTALTGGLLALGQWDIKRLLAFSTISQLGYMMLGLGTGHPELAYLHLVTHAFFKAGLFLSAGAVIHAMHEVEHHLKPEQREGFDAQDMRQMGGLRKTMPMTFWGYTICAAALVGLPLTTGFLSKDAILAGAWETQTIPAVLALAGVLLTGIYMARQWRLVFFDSFRGAQTQTPKEAPLLQRSPVLVLAVLSLFVIVSFNPLHPEGWLLAEAVHGPVWLPWAALAIALGGAVFAFTYLTAGKRGLDQFALPRPIRWALETQFGLDRLWSKDVPIGGIRVGMGFLWLDEVVLSPFMIGLGKAQVLLAVVFAWIDRWVIDGLIGFVTGTATTLGSTLTGLRRGALQLYLIVAIFALLLVIGVLALR